MSETPLQKLIRLRKEKEQANVNPASSNQPQETPALETVSGPSSSSESSTGTEGSGVGSSEGGVVLSEEEIPQNESSLVDHANSKLADHSSSAAVSQVVPEAKSMSAMDRLRALKSGGVKQDAQVGETIKETTGSKVLGSSGSSSSSSSVDSDSSSAELTPSLPPKPRKTHPIAMEMAELEAALDAHVPGFISILSTIHKKLKADPDVVTLLDEEEIAVIVAGLEKHTNVTIVAPSAVKAAKAKARKEPVSAMDL